MRARTANIQAPGRYVARRVPMVSTVALSFPEGGFGAVDAYPVKAYQLGCHTMSFASWTMPFPCSRSRRQAKPQY